MRTKNSKTIRQKDGGQKRSGSVLVLAALVLLILAALGVGMLATAYGVRHGAIRLKNEAAAMLAAEAGYEKAIFWMTQQKDVLSALQKQIEGTSGTLSFADSTCDYEISLLEFIGKVKKTRPVFQVKSVGHSGVFNKTVDVYVIQAIPGWAMGMCRVPMGSTTSYPVNFADGEIIDMPIHINKLSSSIDPYDYRDIYISGEPSFLERVAMGESKYRSGGGDKPGYNDSRDYDDLINLGLFEKGIYFDQPDCRITDEEAVDMKLQRFEASTKEQFKFEPEGTAPLTTTSYTTTKSAVQLEFFVDDEGGKVRITNNCTVLGYKRTNSNTTWDYRITPGSDGTQFETYYIYAYHVRPVSESPQPFKLEQTYVTQSIGGVESEPGGQIYVDGNVVIGSDLSSVAGWGDNVYSKASPPYGNYFKAISAGGNHSLALESDGSIVVWGDNSSGQYNIPSPNTGFVAIAAGGSHSLALKSDGSIVVWGNNDDDKATPPDGNDYIAVSAGGEHSLALKSDGSIVGWGNNDSGQCIIPPPNTGFVAIAAGGSHSLALKSDGSIIGWGDNDYGQASPPVGNNFIAIAAGESHSLGLVQYGQVVKGTVAVVATGNIWIADSIFVDEPHDANGLPTMDNPNALGLIAKGVVKVIDPGMSRYSSSYTEFGYSGGSNYYPGRVPDEYISGSSGYVYAPVANRKPGGEIYERYLSDPTVVEAAVTVGGGGWGAENVARYYSGKYYGGRQQDPTTSWPNDPDQDGLILRGAITECVRGVVGLVGTDGYLKNYYLDDRLLEGILPGDIWLQGKYVPTPAGWHDYRL